MNRTIREAAQVLGISEASLREHLRSRNAINRDGTLAAKHIGGGKLFMDPRVTTPKKFGRPKHYAVLMVTEQGIDWLATQLGVAITNVPSKDSAA
jgi:predicted ArsR family transcriptional regulator